MLLPRADGSLLARVSPSTFRSMRCPGDRMTVRGAGAVLEGLGVTGGVQRARGWAIRQVDAEQLEGAVHPVGHGVPVQVQVLAVRARDLLFSR